MIYYFGMFLLVVGFATIYERKQRAKGIETWESKHNITIPKWATVVLIIIGVLLIFISNLLSNL